MMVLRGYVRKDRKSLPFWPRWSFLGVTWFSWRGFSINEGLYPNLCIAWGDRVLGWSFYCAIAPGLRLKFHV